MLQIRCIISLNINTTPQVAKETDAEGLIIFYQNPDEIFPGFCGDIPCRDGYKFQ